MRELVVLLGNGSAAKGVGLDHVRAGFEILLVNRRNDVGASEDENVIVAFEILFVIGELGAAKVGLAEAVALDHRAHRAIEVHDALGERRIKVRLRICFSREKDGKEKNEGKEGKDEKKAQKILE